MPADPYGRLLAEFADQIGERRATYGQAGRSVREEIVRCVWFGGHFRAEGLETDDGRRVEVLSPGWWNVEGGPDFVRAELLIEGAGRVVGDVEVHTLASSWYNHGHHDQPTYDDVALHVVMWNDREEPTVRTAGGKEVPLLTLSRAVEEDLEELVEVIDPEAEVAERQWSTGEGRYCARAYREGEIGPDWLGRLLDAAGDHRLVERACAVAELLANHPAEQLLYERVAEALGYKSNRMPFLQLAGLVPMADLRRAVAEDAGPEERATLLEAALFGVAGFLPRAEGAEADAETQAYVRRLRNAWETLTSFHERPALTADNWRLAGVRPVNYPTRRIAALARLCAGQLHAGLLAHFLRAALSAHAHGRRRQDVAVRRALLDCLTELEHPYWSHRHRFGGRRMDRPKALVGRERAMSIVVDVLLPMLLAHARREDDAHLAGRLQAVWRGLPRRHDNAVTRRMEHVIFESRQEARKVVDSARRQQGLHQLYRDCCRSDGGCERCVLYLARRAGKTLAPAEQQG
jgi:hypothetical protein